VPPSGDVASQNCLSENYGERLTPSGLDRVLPVRSGDVLGADVVSGHVAVHVDDG
jgi:hypothetical protein